MMSGGSMMRTGTAQPPCESKAALPWLHERIWVLPQPHLLLSKAFTPRLPHTSILEAKLSSPQLSHLLDHQVLGRILFPAAGFFEFARAAAESTLADRPAPGSAAARQAKGNMAAAEKASSPASLALASLAIPAPLPLSAMPSLLRCDVDHASGRLRVHSSTNPEASPVKAREHLHGQLQKLAWGAPGGQQGPPGVPPGSGIRPEASSQALRLAICAPRRPSYAASAIGVIQEHPEHTPLDPAVLDAAFHLGGLGAGAAATASEAGVAPELPKPGAELRIPTGAGCYTAPVGRSQGGSAATWASMLAPPTPGADPSRNYALSGGHGSPFCRLEGLETRPVGSGRKPHSETLAALAAAAAPAGMLYTVECPAGEPFVRASDAAAAAPRQGLLRVALRAQPAQPSAACAQTLAVIQGLMHGTLPSTSLITTGALPSGSSPGGRPCGPSGGLGGSQDPSWALWRTLALESRGSVLGGVKSDPHAVPGSHSAPPVVIEAADLYPGSGPFGSETCAGVRCDPQLAAHAAWQTGARHPNGPAPGGVSVLVTGGLGALGSLVGSWLAQTPLQGLTLLGRTGRLEQLPGAVLHALERTCVTAQKGDISAAEGAEHALRPPGEITAIVHAGGVLADALLANQTAAGVRGAFAAKAAFALRLQAGLAGRPVRSSVLFSSVAALLGSAGQGNYAAANSVLDSSAAAMTHSGLPGVLSLQWGAWAGMGMAAAAAVRVERMGLGLVAPAAGLLVLEQLLGAEGAGARDPVPTVMAAVPFAWGAFLRQAQQQSLSFVSLAAGMSSLPAGGVGAGGGRMRSAPQLAVAPAADWLLEVRVAVAASVGRAVGDEEPLMSSGLDSLGAMDLRAALESSTGLQLPVTLAFDHSTIQVCFSYDLQVLV